MKKYQSVCVRALAFMFALVGYGLTSCSDQESNEPTDPFITVNGEPEATITFNGAFDGEDDPAMRQTVIIESNVEWHLTGFTDWLGISPACGNGKTSVEVFVKEENETATDQISSILLTGKGVTATIEVIQKAGRSECVALPMNIVVENGIIQFEISRSFGTKTFRYAVVPESVVEQNTNKELCDLVKSYSTSEDTGTSSVIIYTDYDANDLEPDTNYYILTIAYNEEGLAGKLIKTPVYIPAN